MRPVPVFCLVTTLNVIREFVIHRVQSIEICGGIWPSFDIEWYLPDLHMMCHPTRRERRRERLYHRHARGVTAGRMKMIAGTWLARARDNILRRDQHALGMAIWTYWGRVLRRLRLLP